MLESVLRWTSSLTALFVVGPLAALLVVGLRAADGSRDVTLLLSRDPVKGLACGAAVLVIAGIFALVVARLVTRGTAAATAGLVVVWSAWQLGTVDAVGKAALGGNPMVRLAIEGLLVGLAGVAIAAIAESQGKTTRRGVGEVLVKPLTETATWASIGAGVLVGALATWFVGYQALKGQAIAAATIGAVGAGAAAHLTALTMGKEPRAIAGYISIALLAAIGPLAAMMWHGGGLEAALRAGPGGLLGVAVPISLHWVAGMLLGVPAGEGWAISMLGSTKQSMANSVVRGLAENVG
jgi:hypothetical protein